MKEIKKRIHPALTKDQYMEIYCRRERLSDRAPVYVSRETHRKLSRTVGLLLQTQVSMSSLLERILTIHFESYHHLITEIGDDEWKRLTDQLDVERRIRNAK